MTRTRMMIISAAALIGLFALSPGAASARTDGPDSVYSQIANARDQYLAKQVTPVSSAYEKIAKARDTYLAQHPQGPTVVATGLPTAAETGFDWGSAAIGAAAGTGLAALLAGSLALVSLRRRSAVNRLTPAG